MTDRNSSLTIINQNSLDIAASKNLEGLELARQKKVIERKNSQIATVINYLKNKLPHGNIDLELVNSLSIREFNRFLTKARWANIWGIVWPGVISVIALSILIMVVKINSVNNTFNAVITISCMLILFLMITLFTIRLDHIISKNSE